MSPSCAVAARSLDAAVCNAFRKRNGAGPLLTLNCNLEHRMNLDTVMREPVLTMVKIKEPDTGQLHFPRRNYRLADSECGAGPSSVVSTCRTAANASLLADAHALAHFGEGISAIIVFV